MQNANKAVHSSNPMVRRIDNVQPTQMIVGIVLILILAGLTGFNPLLGVTSALMLFLWIMAMHRPELVVYGLALILPLTDGLARGSVVPFLRLGQALLVFAFILFLLTRSSPLGKSRLTAIDLAFVLFFLSEAIFPMLALYMRGEHLDLTSSGPYGTSAPLQTLLGPLQYYLVYRIAVATITSEKQITIVLKLCFVASIAVSVIGILEEFLAPVHAFVQAYYPSIVLDTGGPTYLRITSTMQARSALASYLTTTLIVALACSTVRRRLKISSLLLATTLLLGSMAMLLTGTFTSFFGLSVGAVVVCILFRRLPIWIIIALAGTALSALIFQSFFSARLASWLGGADQGLFPTFNYRIMLWKDVFLPAIGQHLLFGAGPAPEVLNIWPTEETQYLSLLLRGGLPYLFSYFLLMGVAVTICWHQIKNKSNDLIRTVAIASLAILAAINVMNVSALYFTYPGITQTLFMLLAIIIASKQLEVQGSSRAVGWIKNKRERVGRETLHEPSKERTTTLAGVPVEGLPTREDFSFHLNPKQPSHTGKRRSLRKIFLEKP